MAFVSKELLVCPLTMDIMIDPVMCDDGFTYEKKAILQITNNISPLTRQPINLKNGTNYHCDYLSNKDHSQLVRHNVNKHNCYYPSNKDHSQHLFIMLCAYPSNKYHSQLIIQISVDCDYPSNKDHSQRLIVQAK